MGRLLAVAATSGKEVGGITVSLPILSEKRESTAGQRDHAVGSVFAAMDVKHGAVCVDVGDLEVEPFVEAQPAGIDRGEVDPVVKGRGAFDNPMDLFAA